MASLGRVPNAEKNDGNLIDVSTLASRRALACAVRGNGKAAAVHRHTLRAYGRGGEARRTAARTSRQIAAAHLRNISQALLACALAAGLGACAPALGDFERPRPSVIHEDVLPFLGKQAAKHRGEPVSDFRYTDYERELRDRSWSLLMPQLERQFFNRWLAEMRRTRLISVEKTVPERGKYVEKLLSQDFRSSGARFARLEMDIRDDRARFPLFVEVANLVADYDRVRERSLARTMDLTAEERANALGRVEENRLLIWTVQKSMRERAGIYRYALERLVIETPDDAAIGAERELLALEAELGVLGPPPQQFAVYGK